MVFQSFALLPVADVMENVQLGLEDLGRAEPEMRRRSLQAIESSGLEGFESAYTERLYEACAQRVGFARSAVVNTNITASWRNVFPLYRCADGPKTMRQTDFLNLWGEGPAVPIKSVLWDRTTLKRPVEMCDSLLISPLMISPVGQAVQTRDQIGQDLKTTFLDRWRPPK